MGLLSNIFHRFIGEKLTFECDAPLSIGDTPLPDNHKNMGAQKKIRIQESSPGSSLFYADVFYRYNNFDNKCSSRWQHDGVALGHTPLDINTALKHLEQIYKNVDQDISSDFDRMRSMMNRRNPSSAEYEPTRNLAYLHA